jgi:hypothetical protein
MCRFRDFLDPGQLAAHRAIAGLPASGGGLVYDARDFFDFFGSCLSVSSRAAWSAWAAMASSQVFTIPPDCSQGDFHGDAPELEYLFGNQSYRTTV